MCKRQVGGICACPSGVCKEDIFRHENKPGYILSWSGWVKQWSCGCPADCICNCEDKPMCDECGSTRCLSEPNDDRKDRLTPKQQFIRDFVLARARALSDSTVNITSAERAVEIWKYIEKQK